MSKGLYQLRDGDRRGLALEQPIPYINIISVPKDDFAITVPRCRSFTRCKGYRPVNEEEIYITSVQIR